MIAYHPIINSMGNTCSLFYEVKRIIKLSDSDEKKHFGENKKEMWWNGRERERERLLKLKWVTYFDLNRSDISGFAGCKKDWVKEREAK